MRSTCFHPGLGSLAVGALLLFLFTTPATLKNVSHSPTNDIQEHVDRNPLNNELDWRLVQEVFRNEQQNVVFSPFSIKLLLTLLYEASGENSKTRSQLSQALTGLDLEKTRLLYQEFLESSTKENKDYEFNIGTKIFVEEKLANITQNYTSLVERCYKTSLEPVVFSDSAKTADIINDWCSKITHGQLNNLVDEELIKEASMIIANALFLKASWSTSFKEEQSRKRPFYVAENVTTEAEFMEQTDIYKYYEDDQLQIQMLKLPYKGRNFAMNMILPYPDRSLEEVVSSLTAENLRKMEENLQREEIVVIIPKYKFDYGTSLNDVLIRLGITEVFTGNASLPQLSGGQSTLQVSQVRQKAGIEVNERGTLAYAVTEIQIINKFGVDQPVEFYADRPFLFYIKDEDSDAILFVGKVVNPVQAESPQPPQPTEASNNA